MFESCDGFSEPEGMLSLVRVVIRYWAEDSLGPSLSPVQHAQSHFQLSSINNYGNSFCTQSPASELDSWQSLACYLLRLVLGEWSPAIPFEIALSGRNGHAPFPQNVALKNVALCTEPNLHSKSHMEQVEVLYTQALTRIDLNVSDSSLLDRGPGSNHKKKKRGPSEQRIRPLLREQINIHHTGVVDIASSDFWLKHPESIIIFIVGDIHRDRIDDKSCVLYFIFV